MEAAKEPVAQEPSKNPASSRPAAGRGNSRKRQRPNGLRSRNKTARAAAQHALRIVALGGGTGLSALLQGLKLYTLPQHGKALLADLSAIVTVSDDGGSSGRLRRAFDILAPGDIRNCMVALAEDETLLARLFQYRFSNGKGLEGHSFGNLFLTALTHVTGDFHQAIQLSSEVLAIRGRIFPSTLANVKLEAQLQSGRLRSGETRISGSPERIKSIRLKPRKCQPLPESLDAIEQADAITFGPGSLYTSIIPNLLVEGVPSAIARSKAVKIYICNLMWQPGETEGYTAADHVRAIQDHAKQRLIDYVVVNSRQPPAAVRKQYAKQNARPVDVDVAEIEALGVQVISASLLAEAQAVRHDSEKLANLIVQVARKGRPPAKPGRGRIRRSAV